VSELDDAVRDNVTAALKEDVGGGDLTAGLVDADAVVGASILARESLVLAGRPWVDEIFDRLDPDAVVDWYVDDGETADDGDVICKLVGRARALLSGERTALNFLQLLSGTATRTAAYVRAIDGTGARILDTRKTIPGLRVAQKYAVRIGGGTNHRAGLYDAILIKENHIDAAGGIAAILATVRASNPDVPVEIEVESVGQLHEALDAGAERVMLDNFDLDALREAVEVNRNHGDRPATLEASGNVSLDTVRAIAETGVDFISAGDLTKNVRSSDLSMLFRIAPAG
jgi:nicotinate-nucleotide pyrophosphorylase (carboxylating)